MSSKYAALPDLDQSQDIYETPDLASDVSTLPTTAPPTTAPDSDIEETSVPTAAAKARFRGTTLDGRDADFSDRISGKRRSYAASSRRRRRRQSGEEYWSEDEDDEDDEDDESIERKLVRLRREVEEVKEMMREREQTEDVDEEDGQKFKGGIEELAAALKTLTTVDADEKGAQARLAKKMAASLGSAITATKEPPNIAQEEVEPTFEPTTGGNTATYTVTYAPAYKKAHTLGKVADLDGRLALLEKVLGISGSALANIDQQLPQQAMIPTLNELSRQMMVLNTSSTSSLDAASRRVKVLASDTEKLTEARKAAKAAVAEGAIDPLESDEIMSKINALYGVLPTIENMAPLLPATLDRLRSLRAIHQDAARASEALKDVESKQEEMAQEIQRWEEALVKVEGVMKETTGTIEGNVMKVEGWIKEIEEKVAKVEALDR
ncbi:Dynamitin-domain-containing protein [Geopyxis carbonaria]|nr:Dynamitin-domain-containing protein [Geopyxis carbonaria]